MKIDFPIHLDSALRSLKGRTQILLKNSDQHFILGWDIENELKISQEKIDLTGVDEYIELNKGKHIFCLMSYDLKNSIETNLESSNEDKIEFPLLHFFTAKNCIVSNKNEIIYTGESGSEDLQKLLIKTEIPSPDNFESVELIAKTGREDYIQNVNYLLNEIQYGSIYEVNYCIQFYAENATIDSLESFLKLDQLAEAPFSVYFNNETHSILSASPERFLKKEGDKLISQPIKGTAKRDTDAEKDLALKNALKQNEKEVSENTMIVDLVRNDLSKIATKNSVNVDEYCEPYTFKTVHQLISTISCQVQPAKKFSDILQATFPMGSMTGAPKISAMNLIEKTENFKRGMYSGSIGVIFPNGDFDLNVVIRTILYNKKKETLSCSVGSAITIHCNPEQEYEECLLKLDALKKVLGGG